jgi:NADH-quinone oxidoreductase subunit E
VKVVLSEPERKEIDAKAAHYEQRRACAVDALEVVQRHRGWISDEALLAVAQYLGMGAAELESVATFYNRIFRRPVGRHVILLCDSMVCWMCGGDPLREALCESLGIRPGETSDDGRFTLLPGPCLGQCDGAPALMVDEEVHRDVTVEGLDGILERYK